jgi:pimeloyl-ACP methyl ester carboxylesterase
MKNVVFCLLAFMSQSAGAVVVPDTSRPVNFNCTSSDTTGFVSVDLRPDFSLLGAQVPQRLTNIMTLLGWGGPNPKIGIYYELAKPFDPGKETIFLAEGFYPNLSLDFVTKHFPYLFKKFNLLQIHFRGSGCSKTPANLSPLYYTHEMVAGDLEVLRMHFKIGKWHSWASASGSFVMLNYALLFPDHVNRIFLRDTAIRAPELKESSDYFKQTLLPEILKPAELQRLQALALNDPAAHASILRYAAAALMRGARDQVSRIVSDSFSELQNHGSSVLVDYIEDSLAQAPLWTEAETANQCLSANETYSDVDYKTVLVTPYAFARCQLLQKNNPQPLVEPLNFTGLLRNVQNSFFIYQGYWNASHIRPLAGQLQTELPNSQIFIDKKVGQGEITPQSLPCLSRLMSLFFSGESRESIASYLEKTCK